MSQPKIADFGRAYRLPLVLGAVALLLMLLEPRSGELLQYRREAIASGQLWRLLTAHLVHLGWAHLLLNLAGLVLVWALVGQHLTVRQWLMLLFLCACGIGAGLFYLDPQLQWYVGLSGVLHGMLVAGALAGLLGRMRRGEALLLLVLVTAKLAWEQFVGPMPGTSSSVGGKVIVDAHLYGALCGAVFSLLHYVVRRMVRFV